MRRLDEVTSLVLAANPGPMTLEGTNTYLVGEEAAGAVIVVDPGPALPEHRSAIEAACGERDAEIAAVVLTHHHPDHAEAAGWAHEWGVPMHTFDPSLVAAPATALDEGGTLAAAGVHLDVVHTPGHASDHVCLRVQETGVVLTGDHVLGRGTTVVTWPDGDMAAYMASLRRLSELGATALYPGHGPVVDEPAAKVSEYLDHRLEREQQVLDALVAGDTTPAEIVRRVYADVDPVLHPAARASVRSHLDKLAAEGRVHRQGEGWRV